MLRDDYLEFFSVEDPRLQEFKRDLMILILKFLLLHIRLGTSLKKKKTESELRRLPNSSSKSSRSRISKGSSFE